nr:MAG TPA: hypothetical protein [Caudoviricetes sp.]
MILSKSNKHIAQGFYSLGVCQIILFFTYFKHWVIRWKVKCIKKVNLYNLSE